MPTNSAATNRARDLQGSDGFRRVARAGYAVSGLLHLVIGWVAIHLALTSSAGGESADQEGALSALGDAPWGVAILWFAVVALATLGAWQVTTAVAVSGSEEDAGSTRMKAVATAVTYLVLAVLAWRVVQGGGSGSGSGTDALMSSPLGRVGVAVAGVVIVAVGGYHVYKGLSQKFTEDLESTGDGAVGRGVIVAGVAGYAAKGVALIIMGVLFVVGAVQADPDKASGLDVALRTLAELPFGKLMLAVVAVGFAAYGLYSFARARYAQM
ncbi:protein of unknown function [Sanguibacter gelidistatuariae]|uniref:DUF1206 domain-containing protein n=1 Tax=Sanguibacter gelidistatuariae TaxID=1814289 RepID=A0A1G6S458_9MICO|nr:DUF1206 domain-containing protein [Sanguibacter gelidistatuariae]SDD10927.1 protein of unknown function [Sanguibacter gelidistatuariae]